MNLPRYLWKHTYLVTGTSSLQHFLFVAMQEEEMVSRQPHICTGYIGGEREDECWLDTTMNVSLF